MCVYYNSAILPPGKCMEARHLISCQKEEEQDWD
jgi:hypothetical protein